MSLWARAWRAGILEAEIIISYDDAKTAEAVAAAVSPDNSQAPPGLFVKTERQGDKVLTSIRCEGELTTFIATIDDLLSSISVAEKTLKMLRKVI